MRSNGLILDLLLIYVYWYMCGIIPTYNFISILMKGLSVIGRMWIHTLVKNTREWCVSDTCEYVRGTWEWVEEVWGCIKTNISHARLCEWREKMKVGARVRVTYNMSSELQHRTTRKSQWEPHVRTTFKVSPETRTNYIRNHSQSESEPRARTTHKLRSNYHQHFAPASRVNSTRKTHKLHTESRANCH